MQNDAITISLARTPRDSAAATALPVQSVLPSLASVQDLNPVGRTLKAADSQGETLCINVAALLRDSRHALPRIVHQLNFGNAGDDLSQFCNRNTQRNRHLKDA